MKYDIFISYRREGGYETAQMISQHLKHLGYSVFFDLENLREGKFNTKLLEVIRQCKDFIIVLPQDGLDRCIADNDDWVLQELSCAISEKKNIVPVMLRGFTFPEKLPDEINEIRYFNGVAAGDYNYTDATLKRLCSFLKSKHGFSFRRFKYQTIAVVAALVIAAAVIGLVAEKRNKEYVKTCVEMTKVMCAGVSVVDINWDVVGGLYDEWKEFYSDIKKASPRDTASIRNDFLKYLNRREKDIVGMTPEMYLTEENALLLSKHNVNPEEMETFYMFLESMVDDAHNYFSKLAVLAKTTRGYDNFDVIAESDFKMYTHSANMFYYGFLENLTYLPEEVYADVEKFRATWPHFHSISLRFPASEYESLMEGELTELENIVAFMKALNANSDYDLSKIEYELNEIDRRIEETIGDDPVDKALYAYSQLLEDQHLPQIGVIVEAIENDAVHPVFRRGDIIVERKGIEITDTDQYFGLYEAPSENRVKFYRLDESNELKLHDEVIPASDIRIGIVSLFGK